MHLLRSRGHVALKELFSECKSRSELVATFLSVLELCSDGRIEVTGRDGGYDITGTETEAEN